MWQFLFYDVHFVMATFALQARNPFRSASCGLVRNWAVCARLGLNIVGFVQAVASVIVVSVVAVAILNMCPRGEIMAFCRDFVVQLFLTASFASSAFITF